MNIQGPSFLRRLLLPAAAAAAITLGLVAGERDASAQVAGVEIVPASPGYGYAWAQPGYWGYRPGYGRTWYGGGWRASGLRAGVGGVATRAEAGATAAVDMVVPGAMAAADMAAAAGMAVVDMAAAGTEAGATVAGMAAEDTGTGSRRGELMGLLPAHASGRGRETRRVARNLAVRRAYASGGGASSPLVAWWCSCVLPTLR